MTYVIIDGYQPDSQESGFFMREYRTFDVESMPQAKKLAFEEFSELFNVWIYDDETGRERMPLLAVWHSKLQQWEDTHSNQHIAFTRECK